MCYWESIWDYYCDESRNKLCWLDFKWSQTVLKYMAGVLVQRKSWNQYDVVFLQRSDAEYSLPWISDNAIAILVCSIYRPERTTFMECLWLQKYKKKKFCFISWYNRGRNIVLQGKSPPPGLEESRKWAIKENSDKSKCCAWHCDKVTVYEVVPDWFLFTLLSFSYLDLIPLRGEEANYDCWSEFEVIASRWAVVARYNHSSCAASGFVFRCGQWKCKTRWDCFSEVTVSIWSWCEQITALDVQM